MRVDLTMSGMTGKVESNPAKIVQGVPKKMSDSDFLVIAASAA